FFPKFIRGNDIQNVHYLEPLFNPKNVAIVGASHHEGKIGHTVVKNIIESGYKGKVYPINPKGGEILGLRVYKNILEIEEDIDLAIITVPANVAVNVIEDVARKAKFIIVITSGFSEVGNVEGEKRLVETAKKHGSRILGPNVFGIYSAKPPINATFGPSKIKKGNIAVVSQSGALGIAMIGRASEENMGLSAMVSIGNKADLTEVEILSYLFQDEHTKVVFLYIEGLENGREFLDIIRKRPPNKSIIVLKAGRSKAGARAVASHTGSLAGSDRIFDAAFRQVGILRADSLEDGLNWVTTVALSPAPKGKNVVIITNGGGLGVIAADACEKYGLHLFDDMEVLKKTFQDVMPEFGSYKNPVDLTGQAGGKEYREALERAFKEDSIHAILALYCDRGDSIEELKEALIEVHKKYRNVKPALYTLFGGEGATNIIQALKREGIPAFSDVEDAVSSLYALYKVNERKDEGEFEEIEMDDEKIREIIENARKEGRNKLLSHEAKEILRAVGIDVPEFYLAKSIDDAVKAANKIGYPVVMKIVSEDIIHKTDVGGVALNIENEKEVVEAFEAIMENCKRNVPHAKIRGIEISKMLPKGVETIVGSTTDASFGKVVMFGLGGIYVEVMKDVTFRVAPVPKKEIRRMIREVESYPLLMGVRGEKRKDIDAIVDTIYRVGLLVDKFKEIVELDINPLIVYEKGAKVVDARMVIKVEK
ncbi:MAG: acetate--CoA ligase family protein, partial [Thermoplasmata archaeon]|nr:acetate--CoA ligase family protein [Thermoplasmata archaeon]